VKRPALEEVDNRKLPNHQTDDGQEQSPLVMLDPNYAPKAVEAKQFRTPQIAAGNHDLAGALNM